jgi:hypothetical protein
MATVLIMKTKEIVEDLNTLLQLGLPDIRERYRNLWAFYKKQRQRRRKETLKITELKNKIADLEIEKAKNSKRSMYEERRLSRL